MLERKFFDWSKPALVTAAESLLHSGTQGATADLSDLLVVVPGGQARRRLEEILVTTADDRGVVLLPPEVVTIGRLPELLYEPKFQFADNLTQNLVWVRVLQAMSREDLQKIVTQPPDRSDLLSWLSLGEMLSALHRELAADRLDFSKVQEQLAALGIEREHGRWQSLAKAQTAYLGTLDALALWDQQTARLFAIEHREFQTNREIVLIGLVEMNQAQRAMLELVSGQVTAYVFCSDVFREHFDDFGCLRPERWLSVQLPAIAECSRVVAGPGEQADAVVAELKALDGRYPADDIAISVPDERVVPYLRQRLGDCQVPMRHGVGLPAGQSPLVRMLRSMTTFLDRRGFSDFANLVRHPDVETWLVTQFGRGHWLTALDETYNNSLPDRLSLSEWIERADEVEATADETVDLRSADRRQRELTEILRAIRDWLAPLQEAARPLREWVPIIRAVCLQVVTQTVFDLELPAEQQRVAAFDALGTALETLEGQPADIMPITSGADALRLALRLLESARLPEPNDAAAIEVFGWLDLRMDDAPVAIVTGFNEGYVPASRNGDVFLPNELRRRLSVEDNDRRYARDAYALATLLASKDVLRVIAGRRSSQNDPLIPSRLLFATDNENLPARVQAVFGDDDRVDSHSTGATALQMRAGQTQSQFSVPLPQPLRGPVESMRVTEFADYLRCPYRYYLKHRLRLKTRTTTATELPAFTFGNLLHEVLERFALNPDSAKSTDAEAIRRFLSHTLDDVSREWFHNSARAAVPVQVEFARLRLHAFADWQAKWRAEGWSIAAVEHVPDDCVLDVDGTPMRLSGRIDRIDVRAAKHGGVEVAVLDYKTGDNPADPEKKHRQKGEWVDLQLPLYRYLLKSFSDFDATKPLQLGYVTLPKEADKTGGRFAAWTPEELAQADELACEIVRLVRNEQFPMSTSSGAGRYFSEFAAICQDDLYAADVAESLESVDETE